MQNLGCRRNLVRPSRRTWGWLQRCSEPSDSSGQFLAGLESCKLGLRALLDGEKKTLRNSWTLLIHPPLEEAELEGSGEAFSIFLAKVKKLSSSKVDEMDQIHSGPCGAVLVMIFVERICGRCPVLWPQDGISTFWGWHVLAGFFRLWPPVCTGMICGWAWTGRDEGQPFQVWGLSMRDWVTATSEGAQQVDWCYINSSVDGVPERCGEEGAEPEDEALDLVDLHFQPSPMVMSFG